MGMTTFVIGILDDAEYEKMLSVYNTCKDAGVSIPPEVEIYFDGFDPELGGRITTIKSEKYNDQSRDGIIVELDKIPEKVKKIVFINSW